MRCWLRGQALLGVHVSLACASAASTRHYAHVTALLRQSWARNALRPWMCTKQECRAVNRGTLTACEQCSSQKPSLRGWKCVKCNTCNYSGVKRCKSCGADATDSKEFWMCAVCKENNRVDEIEDNSRCGHCGYDMAPMTQTEEQAMRTIQEKSQAVRERQEQYDALTAEQATEQWGDALADVKDLPAAARHPLSTLTLPTVTMQPLDTCDGATLRGKMAASLPGSGAGAHATSTTTTTQTAAGAAPGGDKSPPGFDWACRERTCGQLNAGDEAVCTQCGTPFCAAEWTCGECAAVNHSSRSRCFSCMTDIPACWTCTQCGTRTSIYEPHCRSCQAAQPQPTPRTPYEVRRTRASGGGGHAAASSPRHADWVCEKCGGNNFARRGECYQCGAPRSNSVTSLLSSNAPGSSYASSHRERGGQDNWPCAGCGARNFRTRTTCWQCGQASTQGTPQPSTAPHYAKEGFQDDGGTRGWSAGASVNSWKKKSDDWTCAKCFASNFRHRNECFKCGTRKQAFTGQTRTTARKPVKL